MKFQATITLAILLLALAGCSSQPATGVIGEQGNAAVSDSSVIPVTDTNLQSNSLHPITLDQPTDTNLPVDALAKHIIYFDLDSYIVKPEYQPVLKQHASYLGKNTKAQVMIQGSADERGSREYNLALGQKRAEAIKRSLHLLGVREKQIEAVSIGEEQPVCIEAAESCWARNRKGELVYLLLAK